MGIFGVIGFAFSILIVIVFFAIEINLRKLLAVQERSLAVQEEILASLQKKDWE